MESQVQDQTEKLLTAFRIAKKEFPQFKAEQLVDVLALCENNGGLLVRGHILVAFFRYHPGARVGDLTLADIVADFNIEVLHSLDLRDGPIVHVVAFVAPVGGYRLFRSTIDAINPWAVSAHRWDNDNMRFTVHRNTRWRKS